MTIVQTRCDRPDDDISPVREKVIKEAFGRYALVHFSAATNRGRADLVEKVAESVAYLRERQGVATIGIARQRVKAKLEAMRAADAKLPSRQRRHRTLTQADFRKICAEAELKSEPEFLLDYLHRAGVVFYRSDIFKDRIILDQTWALDAIYAVFNQTDSYHQLRRFGGRFHALAPRSAGLAANSDMFRPPIPINSRPPRRGSPRPVCGLVDKALWH